MQPSNPSNVISGLPDNSFGGMPAGPAPQPQYQQPAPQPYQQPQQQVQPVDFSQFANPDPSQQPGFFGPAQAQPPLFGDANGQQPQPQYQQPWLPGQQPAQAQPQPGQPQPYQQPQYQQPQMPAQQTNEPPAWAVEMKQLLEQNQQVQQQPAPQSQQSWKPRSWDEVVEKSREAAQEVLTNAQKEQQAQVQAEEAKVQEIMQDLDNQLNTLSSTGQIPAISNPADQNDQGRSYRRELLGLANATGSTNLVTLNQNLIAAHQAGMVFDPQQQQFVRFNGSNQAGNSPAPMMPGMNSPIGGASSSGGNMPSASTLPPIHELRNRSVSELMQGLTNDVAQYIG